MSLNYERVRYQLERCVIQQDIGLTKVVDMFQNKLCLNGKTPKKTFSISDRYGPIQPKTLKLPLMLSDWLYA